MRIGVAAARTEGPMHNAGEPRDRKARSVGLENPTALSTYATREEP
jgi:hypothetical protein